MKKLLLIIDPQNDFVDKKGSLYVPKAEAGIDAIVKFISDHKEEISDIAITQDTHHKYHIAHPAFWYPRPEPFTQITAEDYRDGVYSAIMYPSREDKPYDPFIMQYLESLPGPLTIWPEHCLEGSWGWAFPDVLSDALHLWEIQNPLKRFKIYQKGMWGNCEAFSLFTPVAFDYRPYADLDIFANYDEIIVCGFAKDICVARTVKDMLDSGLYEGKIAVFEKGMASIDENSPMNDIFSGLKKI